MNNTKNYIGYNNRKNEVRLAPPWTIYYEELLALFNEDPEVKIELDEQECSIKLLVSNTDKADALTQLLPTEKTFGNVTFKITVIPPNYSEDDRIGMIKRAFSGNPIMTDIRSTTWPGGGEVWYVLFKKMVVQLKNDDISDYYGVKSTLYQDIAKDVIVEGDNIKFCTDRYERVDKARTDCWRPWKEWKDGEEF